MIVVDGSALVQAVVADRRGRVVTAALRDRSAWAPDIIDAEVMNALRGLERGGRLDTARAELAVSRLVTGPIQRVSSRSLAHRAWALRHNLCLYDALYVALATQQHAALITADRGMAAAAMDAGVTVTLV